MDVQPYNRDVWNREVDGGNNRWTQPVNSDVIAKVKQGEFSILLTENIPVPQRWFPPLKGEDVICLASEGGQCDAGFVITDMYENYMLESPIITITPVILQHAQ